MVVGKEERSQGARPGQLGIDKGDCDVAGAPGGGEPLMVICESSRVHEGPALSWGVDGAVVAQEPTAPTLGNRKHQCPFPATPCLSVLPYVMAKWPSALLAWGCHKLPKEDTK